MADKTQKLDNEHADEQIEVSGSSISSKSEEDDHGQFNQNAKQPIRQQGDHFGGGGKQVTVQGGYQPSEYANLPVSAQVKELFKSIQRYTPILMDLDTRLKAFVPQFIPAIGEVDAFLKMPRPDGQPQVLGLNVLDQPALNQSDEAELNLRLGTINKVSGVKQSKIHSIQSAEKDPKQILKWISSVADIHKSKQPPSVSYSRPMPDIDSLMQVWPQQVQEVLSDMSMPGQDIDLSIADYSKVACNIVDIPVHGGSPNAIVQSLHVLFTLYSAFKENQHFQIGGQNQSYMDGQGVR